MYVSWELHMTENSNRIDGDEIDLKRKHLQLSKAHGHSDSVPIDIFC